MADDQPGRATRPSLLMRLRDLQDADSWQLFVVTYEPLIRAYCRRKGLQEADAADVCQDVLAQVSQSLRTFEYQPERGRFRNWLLTVTRQKLARFLHRQNRTIRGTGEAPLDQAVDASPDAAWTDEFNIRVLRVCLERIEAEFEPVTWQAFQRVWLDVQPAAEVARLLNLPVANVYAAKSRVLKRLRQEILLVAEDALLPVP
jgi:RNA polymerase sigma-70 factor (ECF subfamily)